MANTIIKENLLQKETIRLLDKNLVIFPWANTKYEWELKKQWDTVTVQTVPNVTWLDGWTAWESITQQDFAITSQNLTVDQVTQINIRIKDIEEVQSNLDLESKIADRIAYGLRDKFDQFIYELASAGAGTTQGSVAISKSNIYATLEAMAVVLANNNVPSENRALFVKPEVASLIRQAPEFDGFREWLEVRINGFVGKMAWFMIMESNNVTAWEFLAMDKESVHFVAQMTKMKIMDGNDGFYSNLLGESVYWGKVFTENDKRIVKQPYTLA